MTASTVTSKRVKRYKLDQRKLQSGTPIPGSIYAPDGTVLVRKGRVLKDNALSLLGDRLKTGLFGDTDWPDHCFIIPLVEPPPAWPDIAARPAEIGGPVVAASPPIKELSPIPVDTLQIGRRLLFDVHDADGVILLRSGEHVTHSFVAGLRQAKVRTVQVPKSAVASKTAYEQAASKHRVARELDEVIQSLTRSEMRLGDTLRPRCDLPIDELEVEVRRGLELHRKSMDRVAEFSQDVYQGRASSVAPATDVVNSFLDLVNQDSSLLPVVAAFKQTPGDYLFQHALNVSLLSIAVAAQLSVRRENLIQIGVGALLQDIGMLKIPEEIRMAPRALTLKEREQIAMHPLHSLDIIRELDGVGRLSLLICYQSHERNSGGGYPRRLRGDMVHPYAKLVGAANAYTAMTSDRPYRPAMGPYKAMETLLHEASADRFDRAVVRTVLDCVSLFPLGSFVRLSDGQAAKVLRANPGQHTRPVVLRVDKDGQAMSEEIDLSQVDGVYVVQALGAKPTTEVV